MEINDKTLICFTASYPYGKSETYFENELFFLSKNFKKIIIIPSYNPFGGERRKVPNNVVVYDVVLKQGKGRIIDFIINFKINKSHLKEFFFNKVFANKSKLKNWFLSVVSYGKNFNYFKKCEFNAQEVILYSYWTGQNFFIEESLNEYKKIIRMHGGDFYLERNNGYLPLQKIIYQSADLLLPISKDIYNKLLNQYKVKKNNIELSYLGVTNYQHNCAVNNHHNFLKIISCSNVYPLKRIDLIYDILSQINSKIQIEWTHIGDGEILESLLQQFNFKKRDNIKINFLGRKSQPELKEIYQNNYFDFFINTSEYEGLPVSIMEAFSFGIPAIATNVGGTCEIVNEKNGLLIDKIFNVIDVARRIENLFLEKRYDLRTKAFETWNNVFNAEINYTNLVKRIENLK